MIFQGLGFGLKVWVHVLGFGMYASLVQFFGAWVLKVMVLESLCACGKGREIETGRQREIERD